MEILLGLAMLAFAIWVYFVPAIVAARRRHRNRTAITVLNVCLGWTLLGWIAALVWAYTKDVEASAPQRLATDAPGESHGLVGLFGTSSTTPAVAEPTHKDCPYCGEQILAKAIRCKHCQADLTASA